MPPQINIITRIPVPLCPGGPVGPDGPCEPVGPGPTPGGPVGPRGGCGLGTSIIGLGGPFCPMRTQRFVMIRVGQDCVLMPMILIKMIPVSLIRSKDCKELLGIGA